MWWFRSREGSEASFHDKMVEYNVALLNQKKMNGTLNFSDLAMLVLDL